MTSTTARIKALDLFAGTGWGVACRRLGIKEMGVEIMPEAVATREANGMETIYRDVWDGLFMTEAEHRAAYGPYGLLIASPPCQTFSTAGNGAGRRAMSEVLEAIDVHAYKDPDALRSFGERHDPRTALVLTPLAYVWRDRPRLVAMEQVATVLPVWLACAEVMREWGYEVQVEVLNAEQYGVPQTRKRAILVARRGGGAAKLPVPTHSRYYPRDPGRLDPGVKRWATMADALGWGMTDRPMPTITGGVHGPTDRWASGGTAARRTVDSRVGGPNWIFPDTLPDPSSRTQYGMRLGVDEAAALQSYPPLTAYTQNKGLAHQAVRTLDQPAPTVTAGKDYNNRGFIGADGEFMEATPDQMAALQSYPVFRNGNQAHAARRTLDQPAPTLHFGQRSNKVEWMDPALANDPAADGERVTLGQAAALQSYPPAEDFTWMGTKSKKFLQIGNAVPPLMAEAVLAALIGIRPGR